MSMLITGIAELVTCESTTEGAVDEPLHAGLGVLRDAAVVIGGGGEDSAPTVEWVGPAAQAPAADWAIDLEGRSVVPGFVDSHSHLVFAGDRSAEFAARMSGTPYDGGGIAVTVEATRAATDGELRATLQHRVQEMRAQGTTTVEVKSGYGLTVEDEVRALRLAREVTPEVTYLGAHVVPPDRRDPAGRAAYLDLVCGEMLQACAPHARWVDVFCEPASPHAFDGQESRRVLEAGRDAGLELRVHGNQLGEGPGAQLAVELGAASVDHCTYLTDADVEALAGSDTVATLLPGVEFSTRQPYPDARRLLDAGARVAIASDCNPGTCYSSSMPLMIALAVREMGMTPAEALRAATVGGAQALRRTDIGRVAVGLRADLALVDAPSWLHIPYRVGVPVVRALEV
ncbi:imidazolonepropionase [Ornithinimicrobium pekingense]|uniref:Imidazolonepropionase n=1 Tax=Ornithinimicrobium pekingense TaxID=384677 RepID=A0ABQ2FCB1_9MICO|nr:imidazolonepropionase [Ornithinimicrobium pekingense]GGK71728.1 imidazolonepropionase [Ornithinimicrobium pekingense]